MQDRPESETGPTSPDAGADGQTNARGRRAVLRAALIGGPIFLTLRASRAQVVDCTATVSNACPPV